MIYGNPYQKDLFRYYRICTFYPISELDAPLTFVFMAFIVRFFPQTMSVSGGLLEGPHLVDWSESTVFILLLMIGCFVVLFLVVIYRVILRTEVHVSDKLIFHNNIDISQSKFYQYYNLKNSAVPKPIAPAQITFSISFRNSKAETIDFFEIPQNDSWPRKELLYSSFTDISISSFP